MKKLIILLFAILPSLSISQSLGKDRVEKLNNSVVRILIGKEASGTGFFVHKDGWVATCEHVISPAYVRDKITNGVIGLKEVYIEFQNGEKVEVEIMEYLLKGGFENSLAYDYSLLKVKSVPKTEYQVLKIGSWSNIEEGDNIYSSGYPLGIKQRFISQGLLSTKWTDSITLIDDKNNKFQKYKKAAWLDLTMNRGNSGGAVIKLGNTPDEDEVIGIATFILNPYANATDELIKFHSSDKPKIDIVMSGISTNKVNELYARAISNNSIGVSGCISIDYLSAILSLVNP